MNRDPYTGEQLRFDRTCPDFHPEKHMKLDDLLVYLLGFSFFAAIVGGVIIAVVLIFL
jgi:hypothetical protein